MLAVVDKNDAALFLFLEQATRETSSRFGSYTSGFGCTPFSDKSSKNIISRLYFSSTCYFFVPISHVAQGVDHTGSPAFPFLSNVRKSTNNPAVHPPTTAVTVKYVLSLRAAVIARSAPPGIADSLSNTISVAIQKEIRTTQRVHGNTAYCVEHIRSLSRLHADSHRHLQP
jgi:hypothetical protein